MTDHYARDLDVLQEQIDEFKGLRKQTKDFRDKYETRPIENKINKLILKKLKCMEQNYYVHAEKQLESIVCPPKKSRAQKTSSPKNRRSKSPSPPPPRSPRSPRASQRKSKSPSSPQRKSASASPRRSKSKSKTPPSPINLSSGASSRVSPARQRSSPNKRKRSENSYEGSELKRFLRSGRPY